MAKLLPGTRIYGTGTVDSTFFINGTAVSTSTNTGALIVAGGAAVGYNLFVGSQALIGQSTVTITGVASGFIASPAFILGGQTTDSMYFRRNSNGNYALQTNNGNNAGNIALQPYGGQVAIGTNGVLQASSPSTTSTQTGALVVQGGIGVGDSVYVGNRVGFVSTVTNASAVYQIYNSITNSLDTVFG